MNLIDAIHLNLERDMERIRAERSLVHHITNYVAMNDSANITLAIGATPVMSHAHEELDEMVSLASALLINIGTLDEYWLQSMLIAGRKAAKKRIPVLLDPVGAGATKLRTRAALTLLSAFDIAIVKGNYGEILSLLGAKGVVRGVDSTANEYEAGEAVKRLSARHSNVCVATGPKDFFSDGSSIYVLQNGHPLLGSITASGCMLGSVIASFMAIQKNYLLAAIEGAVCYEVAGEIAAKADSSGSFRTKLIDVISKLKARDVLDRLKMEEIG
jgi:hydroxyethylthiazole kinase